MKLCAMMLTGDSEHKNSTLDAAGVRHYYQSNTIRSSNAKGRKKDQRLYPVCCYSCVTVANKCKNVENCTYQYKESVQTSCNQQVEVLRNSGTSNFTELQLSRAVAKIKVSYFENVDAKAAQTALGLLTLPPIPPDSYEFDEHSSADRLHCLSWDVLKDKDGLSPRFAQMGPDQRIHAAWFREATTLVIKKASLTQSRSTMPHDHMAFMASL